MSSISTTVGLDLSPLSLMFIVPLVAYVLIEIVGMWKVFEKAGQPGWGAIIPFYNLYLLCKIAGRPGWWWALGLIPFVGGLIWFVLSLLVSLDIATRFGKGGGFGVGLWLLGFVFYPILGFGSASSHSPRMGMGTTPYAAPPYPLDPQYGQQPPAYGQQTWQRYGQQPTPPPGQPYAGAAPTGAPWVAPSAPPPWATQSASQQGPPAPPAAPAPQAAAPAPPAPQAAPPVPQAAPPAPQQAPVSASLPPASPAPPAQSAPAPQAAPSADVPAQAPQQPAPAQQAPPTSAGPSAAPPAPPAPPTPPTPPTQG
jgi:hypothetical protein